jgi:hypothetical protein
MIQNDESGRSLFLPRVELSPEGRETRTLQRMKRTSLLFSVASLAFIILWAMAALTGCGDNCNPRIRTDVLPDGTVGVFYKVKLDSDCSSWAESSWFLSEGTLPPGIALLTDGEISGTPAAAGTFFFTVGLENINSGQRSFKGLSLTINQPAPDIRVAPMNHDFLSVVVGASSPPLEVTISNEGNATLSVSDISLASGTDYSLDLNAGSNPCVDAVPSLLAGENCTVEVTFSPLAWGTANDTLSISSDDADEPVVNVVLSGTGI